MQWLDEGICLNLKNYGEAKTIATFLTREHGVHLGVTRRSKQHPLHQGSLYQLQWKARLRDHLGQWQSDPMVDVLGHIVHDPQKILALGSACALIHSLLPERMPHPLIFEALHAFMLSLAEGTAWVRAYIFLEYRLLQDAGWQMQWDRCAVTQRAEGLAYLSPRTGNTVTLAGAKGYESQLIPYPLKGPFTLDTMEPHEQGAVLALYGALFDYMFARMPELTTVPQVRRAFCGLMG